MADRRQLNASAVDVAGEPFRDCQNRHGNLPSICRASTREHLSNREEMNAP